MESDILVERVATRITWGSCVSLPDIYPVQALPSGNELALCAKCRGDH